MTKKLILMLLLVLTLAGCKRPIIKEPPEYNNDVFPKEYYQILADKKVYLTSFGQSIDVDDLDFAMRSVDGLEYKRDDYLEVGDISDDAVLIIVVGCSVKGLLEAGISISEESLRALAIFNQKENKNLTIISFHIGGPSRRGSTSDGLIEEIFSKSDFNIFYSEGNFDEKLSLISHNYNVKAFRYDSPNQLLVVLKNLFFGEEIR